MKDRLQQITGLLQKNIVRHRLPWIHTFRRTRFLASIYLILFTLFALLATYVYFNPVIYLDILITREFQEEQTPWLNVLMLAVSFPGDFAYISSGLVLLAAAAFWILRLHLESLLIVVHSAVSAGLNMLIKLLINRPRPTDDLVDILTLAPGMSYPSGHVMAYMALWGLLFSLGIILLKMNTWWHYALLIIPAFFVLLVGPSRIYLGNHWASDVLGGYIFSILLLGINLWVYLHLKKRGVLATR